MKKLIATLALTIAAGIGFAATTHADGVADPIPQAVTADDCISGTTRWTLQPCGAPAPTTVASRPEATAPASTHWCASVGEFQHVALDVHSPCSISVYMLPGKVGGRTVEQRCAGHGNETWLTTVRFKGKVYRVCHDVDF